MLVSIRPGRANHTSHMRKVCEIQPHKDQCCAAESRRLSACDYETKQQEGKMVRTRAAPPSWYLIVRLYVTVDRTIVGLHHRVTICPLYKIKFPSSLID